MVGRKKSTISHLALFIYIFNGFYFATSERSKFSNPDMIRDRDKDEICKPELEEKWVNKLKKPFHPAWMDYCDPYHCNDYYKQACGLNRQFGKFQTFQSTCHLLLNNKCSFYRGTLVYDLVDIKYCRQYEMLRHLHHKCDYNCGDEIELVCAVSSAEHVILFKNQCAMDATICREKNSGVEEVIQYYKLDRDNMTICFDRMFTKIPDGLYFDEYLYWK